MSVTHIYNPVGRPFDPSDRLHQIGERLGSLQGKRLGFIDDMKPNAGMFLRFVEQLIKAKYLIPPTQTVRKNVTPNMAIAHELDPAINGVVVAWGD
jgi:hypothetical protein